jgi:hypothetical protein
MVTGRHVAPDGEGERLSGHRGQNDKQGGWPGFSSFKTCRGVGSMTNRSGHDSGHLGVRANRRYWRGCHPDRMDSW